METVNYTNEFDNQIKNFNELYDKLPEHNVNTYVCDLRSRQRDLEDYVIFTKSKNFSNILD